MAQNKSGLFARTPHHPEGVSGNIAHATSELLGEADRVLSHQVDTRFEGNPVVTATQSPRPGS